MAVGNGNGAADDQDGIAQQTGRQWQWAMAMGNGNGASDDQDGIAQQTGRQWQWAMAMGSGGGAADNLDAAEAPTDRRHALVQKMPWRRPGCRGEAALHETGCEEELEAA